jgi:hypothetical protein
MDFVKNLSAGDIVFVTNYQGSKLCKALVLKVGRKYLTVGASESRRELQFELDTGREHTQYPSTHTLYPNLEEYDQHVRMNNLRERIYCWRHNELLKFSFEDLETVVAIIDKYTKT